jgi:hypothetical protein
MKPSLTLLVMSFTLLYSTLVMSTNTVQQTSTQNQTPSSSGKTSLATVPNYTLDHMLKHFKANKTNTVELALFKPIAFTASLVELPYNRKHGYLAREIKRYSPNSNIVATQGITLASETKQKLSVYIIDELAAGMAAELTIGDNINFQAYHVYNSMNGPGLLVYQWETLAKENLLQRSLSTVLHTIGHWFETDEHDHKNPLDKTTHVDITEGHSH